MLITALAREKERFYQEGIEQGLEQGRVEERTEIILAMVRRGFERTVIADITGLSIAEVEEIALQAGTGSESK